MGGDEDTCPPGIDEDITASRPTPIGGMIRMDCLPGSRYLPWSRATKIHSTPLLVEKHGYRTDPPDCIEWILGEYRIKGSCPNSSIMLSTDQPSHPTLNCDFILPSPGRDSWAIELAIHESILQPSEGSTAWVNTALYHSIGDFKLASHEFPGSICGGDGYCYGEPLVKPLFARSIDSWREKEKHGVKPSTPSKVIPRNTISWSGAKGFYRSKSSSWSYYYNSKRGLGLLRFTSPSGEAVFWLGVYRPKVILLHPYLMVESRLEDGVSISSPLISLESPDGRHLTLASLNPVEAVVNNGVLKVRSSDGDNVIVVSESPPLSGLKQLYNSVSPLVEVKDYRVRGANTQIASVRLGCGILECASFSDGWLDTRIYNPGVEPCISEVKFQGVVEEAYQDNEVVEPLYDRVRFALARVYYGVLKIRVKRSVSLLLRLSGS